MNNRRQFVKKLGTGSLGLALLSAFPQCNAPEIVEGVPTLDLARSTPEMQGLSSQALLNFLEAVEQSNIEFHSIMVVRKGHVVAEGWWHPYGPELKHTLYSLSKSFTSTAIGMAIAEGKMTIEDTVLSFFPEDVPEEVSGNLSAMRVKHLLTMTTGHVKGTLGTMMANTGANWRKSFLEQAVEHEPGTHFLYNTGATYMLSAIVQKVSGQTLFDYLSERLFEPLGIEGADWEEDPEGINVGGYGLRVRTEDIAKLGQLYLQEGKWKGKQLLPKAWVQEATKKQTESQEGDSDWSQGYGYQFWRCKPAPGFYRGDGAFGQYCIVIPHRDTVIAITSESFDMGESMKLVWAHILPALQQDTKPTKDEEISALLQAKLEALSIFLPKTTTASLLQEQLSGKTFVLEANDWEAKSIAFEFTDEHCVFTLANESEKHQVVSGFNQWEVEQNDKTNVKDFFPVSFRTMVPSKIAASASWQNEKTLLLNWCYTESAHSDQLTCYFDGNQVKISFRNSVANGREEEDGRGDLVGRVIG